VECRNRRNEFQKKIERIENFNLGRSHGIKLATNMAKQAMGDLKKYVTVEKPYYLPEHDGDIVTIQFVIRKSR